MRDSSDNPLKKDLLPHFTFSGGKAQEDLPSAVSQNSNPGLTPAEPIHCLRLSPLPYVCGKLSEAHSPLCSQGQKVCLLWRCKSISVP